ncbi:hypothetical protein, partial [Rhizobium sp. Pop5]
VVLAGLAKCGKLDHEAALPSGRRPDISFREGQLAIVADITCVSDAGLDEQNPFTELMRLISDAKSKLGLPSGGLRLQVHSKDVVSNRGRKRVLRLPPRKQLHEFVQREIIPRVREQISEGVSPITIFIDTEDTGIEVIIDPAGSDFTSGGHAAYSAPTILDNNPLYKALKAKADQLRGADSITGVIVVDGDCQALSTERLGHDTVSREQIAQRFLQQYSSVDFVLIIAVQEVLAPTWPARNAIKLMPGLVTRDRSLRSILKGVFEQMLSDLPMPTCSASTGVSQAQTSGYGLGHHGGFKMDSNKLRVSARELMEVLAGQRTFDEDAALGARDGGTPKSEISKKFARELSLGRLPSEISIIPSGEDECDDWIEFRFDSPDPAISRFR